MADMKAEFNFVIGEILRHRAEGKVAELSLNYVEGIPKINLRAVGEENWVRGLQAKLHAMDSKVTIVDDDPQKQAYYFLSRELRPGSGLIRFFGGRAEGPGGTLTCLLASKDIRDVYFAAAGHVLSDFWKVKAPDLSGSIYRNRKGFPATNSKRFLGKLLHLSDKPTPLNHCALPKSLEANHYEKEDETFVDIGIGRLEGEFEWKQRTTCYGSFGELSSGEPTEIIPDLKVTKCGAEEKHATDAFVKDPHKDVVVYGPNGVLYELKGQVILSDAESNSRSNKKNPCSTKIPFAVPGDSGTMVVCKDSKRPLGMLIAGSILDGRYVMTPITALMKYWEKEDLVLLRG